MKKVLKWISGIILFLLLVVIVTIGPIDRSPLKDQEFYQRMMADLDTVQITSYASKNKLAVGWSSANITPDYPMPMAGYKQRPAFESVHDSLYARIIAVDNGAVTCYFISTDLMLFPPVLRDRIYYKIKERGWSNYFLYLSSTHTHNGVGGWDDSVLGNLVLGKYNDKWVEESAEQIVKHMEKAYRLKLESKLSYFESDASEWIENRIAFDEGKIDGWVRGVAIERNDSTKGILFTFSAHATSISKTILQLSGDYPSETIKRLKAEGWNFGMYMAGMVGSHRFKYMPATEYEGIKEESEILVEKITEAHLQSGLSTEIRVAHIPVQYGSSQMRITKNWKVRDWVFRLLAMPLKGKITYLQIGNWAFMGTPCDFSGEIYVRDGLGKLAEQSGKKLIITSFNGDYTGYITDDTHYETVTKEEVMALNWVGPYYGNYYSTVIQRLLKEK
jgi:neutral ceramidase